MQTKIPRIMLAATGSGSGKTTLTCAILKMFLNKKLNTVAFKCGPDYIDPMFHSKVIGASSRNLDMFMLGENVCKYLLAKNSSNADIAVLEGVMGYYDGLGTGIVASSYDLATATKTPTVLIVNGKGAAISVAAMIKGFKEFRSDSNIQGVIVNNISPSVYSFYKDVWEQECGVKMCGCFPPLSSEQVFAGRHLGLITADEISNLQELATQLATLAEEHLDVDVLLDIANNAPALEYEDILMDRIADVTIAVAQDRAFCFYYKDSLELLETLGAKLISFSPLVDKQLPICDGFYLGGGYPELYLRELEDNVEMRNSIKAAIANGLPCLAECGGFMYLFNSIESEGDSAAMCGVINGTASMTTSLKRFGYIQLTAQRDNILAKTGEKIHAHEFHYSDSDCNGHDFLAVKPQRKRSWECVVANESMFAGYPHLHLWGNINFAKNFIRQCQKYAIQKHK